ncbi:endonuclease/exonuclease/phosphatase family protein [Streptomyces aidingensis]|uniref:Exonuclease III n=1 Tax=Streptomyces aidingensis TaxID=910347 RepID=A0A1I1T1B1_9ACTN|nr:endonuclease/exonuclease/phosphatase family protein [Streptomyces aidingensis]SFD52416.1 Exonuclease III [Streptomyces aidingensis]
MTNFLCLYDGSPLRLGGEIKAHYQSEAADNWIGLYRAGSEKWLAFEYAPGSKGVVSFSGRTPRTTKSKLAGIVPGRYVLKLFSGHDPPGLLAESDPFVVEQAPYFLAESMTAPACEAGSECRVPVRGVIESFDEEVTFFKAGGDGWLIVSADGWVTGTAPPGLAGGSGSVVVGARGPHGHTADMTVEVPVGRPGTPPVATLRVASWNAWYDFNHVWSAREKALRVLLEQRVDIVGLQEARERKGTARELATRLGWHYRDHQDRGDVCFVSRHPIVEAADFPGFVLVTVEVNGRRLTLCSVHLDYTHYGPHQAPVGEKRFTARVQKEEMASQRATEMGRILAEIAPRLCTADTVPVILLGDFNSPSHRDWTTAVQKSGFRNWPATLLLERAGMRDTYRTAHPDPRTHPGETWSPTDRWSGARPEPQDRIDFVFCKGSGLSVVDSRTVLTGRITVDDGHWNQFVFNDWPSDHAMVLTTFRLR